MLNLCIHDFVVPVRFCVYAWFQFSVSLSLGFQKANKTVMNLSEFCISCCDYKKTKKGFSTSHQSHIPYVSFRTDLSADAWNCVHIWRGVRIARECDCVWLSLSLFPNVTWLTLTHMYGRKELFFLKIKTLYVFIKH